MRRSLLACTVAVAFLVLGMPAAMADPGKSRGNHVRAGDVSAQGARGDARGPSASGVEHAQTGSARGMNRVGAPDQWKSDGHEPAPVGFPQGLSPSDPDASGNGGLDKPGHTGGFSPDRDGNNGCGNDDDREDDNNGWCGSKPSEAPAPPGPPPGPPPPTGPPTVTPPTGGPPPGSVILPRQVPRPDDDEPLASTGVDPTAILFAGFGFVTAGTGLRARRRNG